MAVLGSLTYVLGVDRATVDASLAEIANFERRLITSAKTSSAAYRDLNREVEKTRLALGTLGGRGAGGGGGDEAAQRTAALTQEIVELARVIGTANNKLRTGTIATDEFRAITQKARTELIGLAKAEELTSAQMLRLTSATATATRNLDRGFSDATARIDRTTQRLRTLIAQFDGRLIDSDTFRARLLDIEKGFQRVGNQAGLTDKDFQKIAVGLRSVGAAMTGLNPATETTSQRIQALAQRIRISANQLEAGTIEFTQFRNEVLLARNALQQLAVTEDLTTREMLELTNATALSGRIMNGYKTRVASVGVSYQAQIALQSTVLGQLARFGPLGVAASAGLQQVAFGLQSASTAGAGLAALLGPITAVILTVATLASTFGIAGKTAIDLEQRQAEVIKTTNLSSESITQLTRNLQATSTVTGTFTKDLIDIASIAGQLGVRGVRNLTLFTNTLNSLGIATDVIGTEGASQLAKFLAAVNTSQEDLGDTAVIVGDVLNELENNLATTAGEILQTTRFTAQLGAQFDVSVRDILGFSAAINSVGLQAEAAGSGLVRTFRDIASAVVKGGRDLEIFSTVAGRSVDEFSTLFREDAGAAVREFILGLAAVDEAGGDVNRILDTLGATELRQLRTLATLQGGWRNFALAIEIANDELRTTDSVNLEVERRLNTVSGQFRILRARIGVAAQVLGEALLPILRGFVDNMNNSSGAIGNVVASLTVLVGAFQSVGNIVGGVADIIIGTLSGLRAVFNRFAEDSSAALRDTFGELAGFVDVLANPLTGIPKLAFEFLEPAALDQLRRFSDAFDELGDRIRRANANAELLRDEGRGADVNLFQVFSAEGGARAAEGINKLFNAFEPLNNALANFDSIAAAARGEVEDLNDITDKSIRLALLNADAIDLTALGLSNLEDKAKKTRTAADVIQELTDKLAAAPKLAEALGRDFDEAAFITAALTSAITELITAFNFSGSDPFILTLMEDLRAVSAETADEVARLRRNLEQALTQRYADVITAKVDRGELGIDDAISELLFQRQKLEGLIAEASASIREGEDGLLDVQSLQRRLQAIEDVLLAFEVDLARGAEGIAASRNERAAAALTARFDTLFERIRFSISAAEAVSGAFTSVGDALEKLRENDIEVTADVIRVLSERFEELRSVNTDLQRELAKNLIIGVQLGIIEPEDAAETLEVEIERLQSRLDAAQLEVDLSIDGEVDPVLLARVAVLTETIQVLRTTIGAITGEELDVGIDPTAVFRLGQHIQLVNEASTEFTERLEAARVKAAESGVGFDEVSTSIGILEDLIGGLLDEGVNPLVRGFDTLTGKLGVLRKTQEDSNAGVALASARNARAAEILATRFGGLDQQIAATISSAERVTGRFTSMQDATEKLRSQGIIPTIEVMDFLAERFLTVAERAALLTQAFGETLLIGVEFGSVNKADAATLVNEEIARLQALLDERLLEVEFMVRGEIDPVLKRRIDLLAGSIEFLQGLLDEFVGKPVDLTVDATADVRTLEGDVALVAEAARDFSKQLAFLQENSALLGTGFAESAVGAKLLEDAITLLQTRGVDPSIEGYQALIDKLREYQRELALAATGEALAASRNARAAGITEERFGNLDQQIAATLQFIEIGRGAFTSYGDALEKLTDAGIPRSVELLDALEERFSRVATSTLRAAEVLAERLTIGVDLDFITAEEAREVVEAEVFRLQGLLDEAELRAEFSVDSDIDPLTLIEIEALRAAIEALLGVLGEPVSVELDADVRSFADQLALVTLAGDEFDATMEAMRRESETLGVEFDENGTAIEILEGLISGLLKGSIDPSIDGFKALVALLGEYRDANIKAKGGPLAAAIGQFEQITGKSRTQLRRLVVTLREFIAAGGPAADIAQKMLDALAPNISAEPLLENADAALAWASAQRTLGRVTREEAITSLQEHRDALIALNIDMDRYPELALLVANSIIKLGAAIQGFIGPSKEITFDKTELNELQGAVEELLDERTEIDLLREKLEDLLDVAPDGGTRELILGLLAALDAVDEGVSKLGSRIRESANTGVAAADTLVSGIGSIVEAAERLIQGRNPIDNITLGLRGMREAIDGINEGDLGSTLLGIGVAAAEAAGQIFGLRGGGELFGAAFGLVQGIVDLFSGDSPARRALSESIAGSVQSGFLTALNSFRKGDIDRTELRAALEDSIGDAVFNAAIGRLIDSTLIVGALKPILDQVSAAILAGDNALINALISQIPGIINRVLPTLIGAAERLGHAIDTYLPGSSITTPSGDGGVFDRIPIPTGPPPSRADRVDSAELTASITSLQETVNALVTRGVKSKVDLSIEDHGDFATIIRTI